MCTCLYECVSVCGGWKLVSSVFLYCCPSYCACVVCVDIYVIHVCVICECVWVYLCMCAYNVLYVHVCICCMHMCVHMLYVLCVYIMYVHCVVCAWVGAGAFMKIQ